MKTEKLADYFLVEHQEGTINQLSKLLVGDEEVLTIFDSMTKEQIYAVASLMNVLMNTASKGDLYLTI